MKMLVFTRHLRFIHKAAGTNIFSFSYSTHTPVNNRSGSTTDMTAPVETSISKKITEALNPTHLEIVNESYMHNVPKGSETHFKVLIVATSFKDQPLIKRHQRVHEILKEELQGPVHALSILAKTPEQWEKSLSTNQPVMTKSPPCLGGFGK